MDDKELPKKMLWKNLGGQRDVTDRNQDGLTGQRKTQGNWVVAIGWRLPSIEVATEICSRKPRPTQGYRAGDDDYSYPASGKQE